MAGPVATYADGCQCSVDTENTFEDTSSACKNITWCPCRRLISSRTARHSKRPLLLIVGTQNDYREVAVFRADWLKVKVEVWSCQFGSVVLVVERSLRAQVPRSVARDSRPDSPHRLPGNDKAKQLVCAQSLLRRVVI